MVVDRETDTAISWTNTGDVVQMWTIIDAIAKEWRSYGLRVGQYSGRGYFAECPKSWVTIRPPKPSALKRDKNG